VALAAVEAAAAAGALDDDKTADREKRRSLMKAGGKTTGIILIVAGLLIGLSCSAWAIIAGMTEQSGTTGGTALGVVIAIIIALPLIGGGIFLMRKGATEEQEFAEVKKEKMLLNAIKTRGQVNISDMVLDLKVTSQEQVKTMLYDLVGKGLFTGYVDWKSGKAYSKEASAMTGRKCPNCGGEQEFAGKGIIKCQYCGSEIFL
jgi:predicted transporter